MKLYTTLKSIKLKLKTNLIERLQESGQIVVASYSQIYSLRVRPGAAGLLIGIECSIVRDSSWMYLPSLVTIRIGVELAAVQRKLPDCVVVGFQLYSARTFHVTLTTTILDFARHLKKASEAYTKRKCLC